MLFDSLPSGLHRRIRNALRSLRFAPALLRREDRCQVVGHGVWVPRGVFHPLADGSTSFFFRTVGPMIAPGARVLDLGTGCGIGALVAASRGATVVACDLSPAAIAATEANLRASGLQDAVDLRQGPVAEVVDDETFDLVALNGPQGPEGYELMASVLEACPAWLGESGRLLLLVDRSTGMRQFISSRLPEGYRELELARSQQLLATFQVVSVGWDLEAARQRRHADRKLERDPGDKARVSRKRWDSSANEPPSEATG